MISSDFDFRINLIGSQLLKIKQFPREPKSTQDRVAVTLRCLLAIGESSTSLQ
jgi:hypothetical protein